MKLFFLIFLLVGWGVVSAQVIRQKINQHFDIPSNADSLNFDGGDAEVIYRKTPGKRILLEVNVEAQNIGPNVMIVLARSNRYKLTKTVSDKIVRLARPKDMPIVRSGDKIMIEKVSYKIYLPSQFW
jgi:hypothetical protein